MGAEWRSTRINQTSMTNTLFLRNEMQTALFYELRIGEEMVGCPLRASQPGNPAVSHAGPAARSRDVCAVELQM